MTEAQEKWLARYTGWERQTGGERQYTQAGLVDPEGNFQLASVTRGADDAKLLNGSILVGIAL